MRQALMNKERIALGSDHRGYEVKAFLVEHMSAVSWFDIGVYDAHPADYPIYAVKACAMVTQKEADKAILLCGSGIGMAIMANRFEGIYAGLAWSKEVAVQSRAHDNTNVLVLPADYVSPEQALEIVSAWLATPFSAKERYKKRIAEIDVLSRRR